ncbi:serine hydrolase domain-containing protein [Streptomyces sp. NPDC001889]
MRNSNQVTRIPARATALALLTAVCAALAPPTAGAHTGVPAGVSAGAGTVANEPAPPALDKGVVERTVDEMVSWTGTPGAMAQVWDRPTGVHPMAAGVADRRTGRPARADLAGRAGGSSMTFVTAVVLQLAEEGRLGLDDGIETYVPGLLPWGEKVTVRMLLNHTSGLHDHLQLPLFADEERYLTVRWKTYQPRELVRMAVDQGKAAEPGEWYFSYTNFTVIGMIIEKVTGRSPQEQVTRRVIEPLKLRGTSFPTYFPFLSKPHARGYFRLDDGSWKDVTELNPTAAGAARGVVSTAPDLIAFWRALLTTDKLIGAKSREELLTFKPVHDPGPGPAPIPTIRRVHQGLGIIRIDWACGVSSYGSHGAAMHGFDTTVHVSSDGGRAASAMTNEYTNDETQGPVLVPFLAAAMCGEHSYPIPPGSTADRS